MTRACEPSRAQRLARQAERMTRARSRVMPGSRPTDYQTGRARTAALPSLDELGLDGPVDEHAMPLVEAAELVVVTQQALNQLVNRGSLVAYQSGGKRWILLDDLLASAPGRRQADRLADERRRLVWLDEHERGGACTGTRCDHWTHEGPVESQPDPIPPVPTDDA